MSQNERRVGNRTTAVRLETERARAAVLPDGAHVVSFVPDGGAEVLFVSRETRVPPAASVRGGVPVIFPQFAELGPLPKHGFARMAAWAPGRRTAAEAVFHLADTPESRALWPHRFAAELAVTLGDEALRIALSVTNAGTEAMPFTGALHTYLRVADARRAVVRGLDGVRFRDKVAGGDHVQAGDVTFAGEVDRMYFGAPEAVRVADPAGGRTLVARKEGFPDVVVWNPWTELARRLPDLADEEYADFVCIEAAHVESPLVLPPGGRWTGAQVLSVEG